MYRVLVFALTAALWLGALQAGAQSMPLTSDLVGKFMTALDQVQKISRKYGDDRLLRGRKMQSQAGGVSPFADVAGSIKAHEGYVEMEKAIKAAGFSDINQWTLTGTKVFSAYGALKMADQQPKINMQMKQAREQIEKSNMSAEQKKQMMKMFDNQAGALAMFQDVPPGDIAAVRPHIARIDAMSRK